jgi:hypothetical protein
MHCGDAQLIGSRALHAGLSRLRLHGASHYDILKGPDSDPAMAAGSLKNSHPDPSRPTFILGVLR